MLLMEQEKIKFPASSENIALVERLIDQICSKYNINEDHYGNILITLTEAVNNAIHHGNQADPSKMVCITFKAVKDGLCFTVKDEGKGFNYENLPDPTDPENIEKPHGRGVFLMKHLADDLEFKDNGRAVSIKFRIAVN